MKKNVQFTANDGTTFDNSEECKDYERNNAAKSLVGLTEEQVMSAMAYTDRPLAKAIETIASRCYIARVEAGDIKKRPRNKKAAAEGETETSEEQPDMQDVQPDDGTRDDTDTSNVAELPRRGKPKKAA